MLPFPCRLPQSLLLTNKTENYRALGQTKAHKKGKFGWEIQGSLRNQGNTWDRKYQVTEGSDLGVYIWWELITRCEESKSPKNYSTCSSKLNRNKTMQGSIESLRQRQEKKKDKFKHTVKEFQRNKARGKLLKCLEKKYRSPRNNRLE